MNIKIKSKFTFPFSPLPFHIAIIITPILLTIIACSPTTEISKGNLSGVIALEGMEDNSAIIVAIYDLAYLDTTIVRINQEYPQIGVIISQHTEFDHRLQSPLYTTETDADGSFEIEKIPTGIYNFVAQKENFGFRYIYEVEISEGENSLSEMGKGRWEKDFSHLPFHLSQRDNRSILSDITLYAEHHISGIISEDIYLAPFHHLVIDSDTEFIPGTNFTIMPNAVVRINPGQDLTIHGNLTAQGEEDNMFWVTSNDGFEVKGNGKWEKGKNPSHFSPFTFHTKRDSLVLYNSMELSPVASVSDNLIEWGKWSWGNNGLMIKKDDLNIQYCILKRSSSGIIATEVDFFIVNACILLNNFGENYAGIFVEECYDTIIQDCISIYNFTGIYSKGGNSELDEATIKNNFVTYCGYGIKSHLHSDNYIHHNLIENCYEWGVEVSGYNYPLIEYNQINCINGIINLSINSQNVTGYSQPSIHFNNLNCSGIAIKTMNRYNTFDIPAENNYFYSIDQNYIYDILIWDYEDAPEWMQEVNLGHILIEPVRLYAIGNAGISFDPF